jgi:hypothetical protein
MQIFTNRNIDFLAGKCVRKSPQEKKCQRKSFGEVFDKKTFTKGTVMSIVNNMKRDFLGKKKTDFIIFT